MTPHYDLKQQEKNNGVFGAGGGGHGGGGHKHFCHISGGVEYVFPTGLGGGGRQNFCLPHENVTAPSPPPHPHLVINDSSLNEYV